MSKDKEELKESTVRLNEVGGGYKLFTIRTNMTQDEIYAATINWSARTQHYSAESLCDYITSKSHMSGHVAIAMFTQRFDKNGKEKP
jgi:hypothetical protein